MKSIVWIGLIFGVSVFAADKFDFPVGKERRPPLEALVVCEGKAEQSHCSVQTPLGETLQGLCRHVPSGEFACVPLGHGEPSQSKKETPPPSPKRTASKANVLKGEAHVLPDTNQRQCFDVMGDRVECMFSGQDGMYTQHRPDFDVHVKGIVTDNITHIMWQKSPDTNNDGRIDYQDKMTINKAFSYCDNLRLGGYDDWVLPDIKSLYSIIDFSGKDIGPQTNPNGKDLHPFLDTRVFDFGYGDTSNGERMIDAQYASSTYYTAKEGMVFGVNMADGRIKGYGLVHPQHGEKRFYVQCARNLKGYGHNMFKENNNQTISDHSTGLMWQQEDSQKPMAWDKAIDYCERSKTAGYEDWRLPNAKELQSIVDYTRSPDTTQSPALHKSFRTTAIINENGQKDFGYFWTSTTHKNDRNVGDHAVYISFGRALGYMRGHWVDVHGAGAQRSDPKSKEILLRERGVKQIGSAYSKGPQGDVLRGENFVRCVRDE